MNPSDGWSRATPLFDDERLASSVGLVPVMELAEQAGLSELVDARVQVASIREASAGVNSAGKVSSGIAGMAAGADNVDDLQVIRSGGMKRLFNQVYAPATLGQFLREFTHGRRLDRTLRPGQRPATSRGGLTTSRESGATGGTQWNDRTARSGEPSRPRSPDITPTL